MPTEVFCQTCLPFFHRTIDFRTCFGPFANQGLAVSVPDRSTAREGFFRCLEPLISSGFAALDIRVNYAQRKLFSNSLAFRYSL